MESTPVAIPPSQKILTLEEVLIRSEQGKQRLVAAGMSTTPKIERRLAWKRSRGIDTTLEERLCTRFKGVVATLFCWVECRSSSRDSAIGASTARP